MIVERWWIYVIRVQQSEFRNNFTQVIKPPLDYIIAIRYLLWILKKKSGYLYGKCSVGRTGYICILACTIFTCVHICTSLTAVWQPNWDTLMVVKIVFILDMCGCRVNDLRTNKKLYKLGDNTFMGYQNGLGCKRWYRFDLVYFSVSILYYIVSCERVKAANVGYIYMWVRWRLAHA